MTILLALVLSLAPCTNDGHNLHRSSTAKSQFRHAHPCPGGVDRRSTVRCHGYVIDHVCPLACCGKDTPSNMQWQREAASKSKDRWELNCSRSCKAAK